MEYYPENSWCGLKAALDAGAEWLECDVQMTRAGNFILLHDQDFKRTAGDARTLFELSELDLDRISIHEPDRLGNRFVGEPVIDLVQVLSNLQAYPTVRIMVEIKQESLDYWGLHKVMNRLLETLHPFQKQVVLISFNLSALHLAKTSRKLDLGWVIDRHTPSSLRDARSLAPDFLIADHRLLSNAGALEKAPWRWMLYDISDPDLAMKWYQRGADLIETRDIGTMLKAMPSSRMPHH